MNKKYEKLTYEQFATTIKDFLYPGDSATIGAAVHTSKWEEILNESIQRDIRDKELEEVRKIIKE